MLHTYLLSNRAKLIDRCRHKVAQRFAPKASAAELEHGVPLFLDQLIKTLKIEQGADRDQSHRVSGAAGGRGATKAGVAASEESEIGDSAKLHGRDLLRHGFTIDQVVHDYGDLCQAITDLAFEEDAKIEVDEFRTLNRCLDNAIADAVTEFASKPGPAMTKKAPAANAPETDLASEIRIKLQTATLALAALKSGKVGFTGATGAVLDRCLAELRTLVDRAFVTTPAGSASKREH